MKYLPLILVSLLLTGCTDIRERRLPDVLAVDAGEACLFAAHTSQDDSVLSCAAAHPLELCAALHNSAGAEISTGHLTMLAVSGDVCTVLSDYFQSQILAPTCEILAVPRNACTLLEQNRLPAPAEIQAAVETGRLPSRTADTIFGDLTGGSGITALHSVENGRLTLTLRDMQEDFGTLSPEACRGLALFDGRWKDFVLEETGNVYHIRRVRLHTHIVQQEKALQITVSGMIHTEPQAAPEAEAALRQMLSAAVTETATAHGADLLFLRETAVRDGIGGAAAASPEEWREMLKNSSCDIRVDFDT